MALLIWLCILGGAVYMGAVLGCCLLTWAISWTFLETSKQEEAGWSGSEWDIGHLEVWAASHKLLQPQSGTFLLESSWMPFCNSHPGESWRGTLALSSSVSPLFHIERGWNAHLRMEVFLGTLSPVAEWWRELRWSQGTTELKTHGIEWMRFFHWWRYLWCPQLAKTQKNGGFGSKAIEVAGINSLLCNSVKKNIESRWYQNPTVS